MTATFGYKLYNTAEFALSTANGIRVQEYSEDLSSKAYPIPIPRRHGSRIDDTQKLNQRTISLGGKIVGATEEGYRTNVNTFLKNIKYGKQKFYKFDDRYIWTNNGTLYTRDGPTLLWGDFTAELICVDPFFYALSESNNVFSTAATTYNFSVTTFGDAVTPARISIAAASDFTNPVITNSTLIQTATYTGTSTNLIENTANLTVLSGGSNALSNFTGEFIELAPGLNNLVFTQNAAVSVTITVYWTDRFY